MDKPLIVWLSEHLTVLEEEMTKKRAEIRELTGALDKLSAADLDWLQDNLSHSGDFGRRVQVRMEKDFRKANA